MSYILESELSHSIIVVKEEWRSVHNLEPPPQKKIRRLYVFHTVTIMILLQPYFCRNWWKYMISTYYKRNHEFAEVFIVFKNVLLFSILAHSWICALKSALFRLKCESVYYIGREPSDRSGKCPLLTCLTYRKRSMEWFKNSVKPQIW